MKLFIYNQKASDIEINKVDVFINRYLKACCDFKRNQCEADPVGEKLLLAKKEFIYMYVRYDYDSYTESYEDYEREDCAISDSGLTKEELNDVVFIAACNEYKKIQDRNEYYPLLNSARRLCLKIQEYWDSIDFTVTDKNGKAVNTPKEAIEGLKQLEPIVERIDGLKRAVRKKNVDSSESISGGQIEGLFDRASKAV
ncbi:MAG: hypothetical protein LBU57_02750 [Dysgonamonadaceae bacterium]|jgi:hypothetical protein|nr:hypothetical protein [Dysgonamonadaceae bacterium]